MKGLILFALDKFCRFCVEQKAIEYKYGKFHEVGGRLDQHGTGRPVSDRFVRTSRRQG
jgi:hypothetical protein